MQNRGLDKWAKNLDNRKKIVNLGVEEEEQNELRAEESPVRLLSSSAVHRKHPLASLSASSLANTLADKLLTVQLIQQGLPIHLFEAIRAITPFSEAEWAVALNVSMKSLGRYKKDRNFVFKSIHTEKIFEMAEVTLFGNKVFDSPEQFQLWLQTPSFALRNHKPIDLLHFSYGKELVMEELIRIDQGIFT